jgi:hypothetical protein
VIDHIEHRAFRLSFTGAPLDGFSQKAFQSI